VTAAAVVVALAAPLNLMVAPAPAAPTLPEIVKVAIFFFYLNDNRALGDELIAVLPH
jgi:hypothetical protein